MLNLSCRSNQLTLRAMSLDFVGRESFLGIESDLGLYCPSFCRSGRPRRQTFLVAYSCRRVMMRKRRKAWGEEFRFWSYMPPFFFDFFFLAFVGLFTRLHTHNGVCLRILLFFRRHDISWQKFPIGQVHCVTYRLLIDFSSSRHFGVSYSISEFALRESSETSSGPISLLHIDPIKFVGAPSLRCCL